MTYGTIRKNMTATIQLLFLTTLFTKLSNNVEAVNCGGVLDNPSGEIASPFYPEHYPVNVSCEWRITGGRSHVNLTFLDFQLEDSSHCNEFDFVEVEFSHRTSGRLCGSLAPLPRVWSLPVAGKEVLVKFHSDTTLTFRGFKVNYVKYDVDPCLVKNGDCQHHCIFHKGKKSCSCKKGYYLKYDGMSCEDIDECYSWKRRHACLNKLCVNTIGGFRCECHAGYRMIRAFHVCVDINECAENKGGCRHNCINRIGGYRCTCNQGFYQDDNSKHCHKTRTSSWIRRRTRRKRY